MRVEINLPDDKVFAEKLKQVLKAARRKRKPWIEVLVIDTVNNATVKPKQGGSNNA